MIDRRTFVGAMAGAGLAAWTDLAEAREAVRHRIAGVSRVMEPLSYDRIVDEYLLDPDIIYLNHASIGTIPRAVHEARTRYLALCERNPWLYMWGGAWEDAREAVREHAARYLGARSAEVAFTHNTTEGFNTLAQGLPLGPGDEVLFSSLNHPGASVCWEHHGRAKGYTVRRFTFPVDRVPHITVAEILTRYDEQITPATRVLVLPHVDNIVGLRHPLRELAALARSRGVEFVAVDGAQSVGMLPLDVAGTGVDFYATSPHKWLQAPKGLGLLYVRADVREQVRPMWVTWGQERWAGTARVFEDYGTRNLPEVLALGDAIAFQEALGAAQKMARYRSLWAMLRERVQSSDRLVWRSPNEWDLSASLVAVEVRDTPIADVLAALWPERGVVFRAFPDPELNTARLSPNVITPEDQIARALTAMERVGH